MSVLGLHRIFFIANLRRRRIAVCCLIFMLGCCRYASAQVPDENQVKAVFIFNFTRFITWPENAFSQKDSPFIIGIVGKNVAPYLAEAIEGERVDKHPIRIRRIKDSREIEGCHILFIEKSHANISGIAEALKGKSVLTVSDADSFMNDFGMIRLYNENDKIRLEIDEKRVEAAGLEISSKLLNLATIHTH